MTLSKGIAKDYPWEVFTDGILHARFKLNSEAVKFMDFIQGNLFAL
jgi:hypothetical protein